MAMKVHVCGGSPSYRYGGYYFEVHSYCGPFLLNRRGDPTNRNPPRAFWQVWEAFDKLSKAEKAKYAA